MRPHPATAPSPRDHPRSFSVRVDLRSGRVRVCGELDRLTAHLLHDVLAALADTRHPHWVVDASGISFCDAEGLRVIVQGHAAAASRDCSMRLVGARPFLRHLLEALDLRYVLDGSPSRREVIPSPAAAGGSLPLATGRPVRARPRASAAPPAPRRR
jgi:anti-anti-sigma factor